MDNFQYDECLKLIRSFVWDILANNYIELIKGRLYDINNNYRKGSQYTLLLVLTTLCKLISPFMPYLSEEIYCKIDPLNSVHTREWPKVNQEFLNSLSKIKIEQINKNCKDIINIAKEIRKYKKENKYPLNYKLKRIEIYNLTNEIDINDLKYATKSDVYIKNNKLNYEIVPIKIICNHKILGPIYKDKTSKIIKYIENIKLNELLNSNGEIKISSFILENITYNLPKNGIKIISEFKQKEEQIDIIEVNSLTIIIHKN